VLTRSAAPTPAPSLLVRDDAEESQRVSARRQRESDEERAERLRTIVREHFANVWRFLRHLGFASHVVDDTVQDLFLLVLRRLDDVLPGSERAFLFAAAIRIATKMVGKGAREMPVGDRVAVPLQPVETAATPETLLADERARQLLMSLLSGLEERQRAVFVMYEIEELTVPEIAEVLDLPVGTVTSRLRAAREDFRARLARHRARTEREVGK